MADDEIRAAQWAFLRTLLLCGYTPDEAVRIVEQPPPNEPPGEAT